MEALALHRIFQWQRELLTTPVSTSSPQRFGIRDLPLSPSHVDNAKESVLPSTCAIAFSSFLYYLFYAPLVYVLFLRGYFSSRKGHLAFLYQSDLYRSRDVGLSVNSGDIRVPSYTAVACNSDPPHPLPVSSMLMARSGTALASPAKSHTLPTTAFDSCVSTNLNKWDGGDSGDDDAEIDWASRQLLGDRRGNRDEDVSPILSRAPGMCRDEDGLRRIGELLANPEGLLSVEDDEDFYTGQPNPARFETAEHH